MSSAYRQDPLARLRPGGGPGGQAVRAFDRGDTVAAAVPESRGRHRSGRAPTPPPDGSVWVRLQGLGGPVVVLLIAAVVAGGLLWWRSAVPGGGEGFVLSAARTGQPVNPAVSSGGATAFSSFATPAGPADTAGLPGAASTPSVTVHVAGAVVEPGVVVVPSGARVIDAVAEAGGMSGEADAGGVNLARELLDGELVVVPTPGQVVSALDPAGGGAPGGGGMTGGVAPAGPAGLVDVNRADEAGLDSLPGIGPVLAGRIIAHREDAGPFGSVEELRSVPGIGEKVFDGIRDLVTV